MTDPRIDHLDGEGRGVYLIARPDGTPGAPLAELEYEWRDGVMTILHTGVREELQGQGVARKLVKRAIADARQGGFRIHPICKYARKVFEKAGAELDDVRAEL